MFVDIFMILIHRRSSMGAIRFPVMRTKTKGCCSSVLAGALDEHDAEQLAQGFRALADPARIRLLSIIAAAPTGEVCACDLVEPLGRAQPTVSHHLSLLVDAGLLTRTKRGRWAWYRLVPERLDALRKALSR
jgi:ArsR family transcriptional regulator, arsenate/arsenite/antimonite-responsive transcriptional repressor